MLKVMTVVGTRPEIIRLSRIINLSDKYFDHTLVHTGQNFDYELNKIFFNQMNIREPDFYLDSASSSSSKSIANVICNIEEIIEKINPEAFVILGDTNSCLSAITAKRHKIPIFHLEAGNRCFDYRVPEEINRKIIDHISDINITYSQISKENLLMEGLSPEQVICAGSPLKEVLEFHEKDIEASNILEKLNLSPGSFFLLSAHREETVDDKENLKQLYQLMSDLSKFYDREIIFSCHPRTQKKLKDLKLKKNQSIRICKPFGYFDYVKLQINSFLVLSDSGTITEESSILNFPANNIREQHERPEGFEEGTVMFTGRSLEKIKNAISILKDQKRGSSRTLNIVNNYNVNNVSQKIIRIILSYTDYVNRKVWKKY